PVRGWIQQQVVKLAAIAAAECDVVLVVDSDVEFIRPFAAEIFVRKGTVRFFCKPNQIDKRLPRHMTWHRVARALLGLPSAEPPYSDYISSPLAWDPMIVRQMLARVTATTGRPWPTAIAEQLHFSECVLYGVFGGGGSGAPASSCASDVPHSLLYWAQTPLNLDSVARLSRGVRRNDRGAVMQSKPRTPLAVRHAGLAPLRGALHTRHGPREPRGG